MTHSATAPGYITNFNEIGQRTAELLMTQTNVRSPFCGEGRGQTLAIYSQSQS